MRTRPFVIVLFFAVFAGSCLDGTGEDRARDILSVNLEDAAAGDAGDVDSSQDGWGQTKERRPFDIESIDVKFEAGDLTMKGTVDRPKGVQGPVPGVVVVHGSGPSSRVGEIPGQLGWRFSDPIETYREIGASLAERGYAVLRYDKRSCGPFNDCRDNGYPLPDREFTLKRYYRDVLAAVEALAKRPKVMSDAIYVIGHSQGAKMAVKVASDRPETVQGAIPLAGTPAPIDEVVRYQYEYSLQSLLDAGLSEEEAKDRLEDTRRLAEQLEALDRGEYDGEMIQGQPVAFWESWLQFTDDVKSLFPTLEDPVVSVSGDRDTNVPPKFARRWEPLFDQSSPRTEHRLEILACISHAMNCIETPADGEPDPEEIGKKVDSKVTTRLTEALDRMHESLRQ